MNTLKKQNGLTMWGWLVILTMVGVMGYQVMVLFTPVTNYFLCDAIVQDRIVKDTSLKFEKSKKKVSDILEVALSRENVPYKVDKESFTLRSAKGGGLQGVIHFEERVKLFWDIDFVVTYHREVVIGSGL